MLGLGPLLALLGLDPAALGALLPAVSIPVWDQYVDLVKWSLTGLADFFGNAGLAIIAFTIIVKTLLLPLTVQSIRSSKAMQDLQPKIKELQKKHGKDRQRLTQETMALYSANRVNPMSGCLPMLLQIPIFLGLYNGINDLSNNGVGVWDGGFLWLPNLDNSDPYKILPILAGAFQFVQTKMMRPYKQGKITDPQQQMMNTVMNIMPLSVILFGWTFAAGPVLYWATQSIYSVVQQWFITGWGSLRDWLPGLPELPEHRRLGYRPPREVADPVVVSGSEDGATVRAPGAMGWLQKRLDQAQQQAAARRGTAADGAGTQARADAESRTIAAASGAPATGAAGAGNGARNGTAANRRGKGGGSGQRAKRGAGSNSAPAARANGQGERADGGSRAVVVPRKARPKDDGANGS